MSKKHKMYGFEFSKVITLEKLEKLDILEIMMSTLV